MIGSGSVNHPKLITLHVLPILHCLFMGKGKGNGSEERRRSGEKEPEP